MGSHACLSQWEKGKQKAGERGERHGAGLSAVKRAEEVVEGARREAAAGVIGAR